VTYREMVVRQRLDALRQVLNGTGLTGEAASAVSPAEGIHHSAGGREQGDRHATTS
jgi:hypothetical protein